MRDTITMLLLVTLVLLSTLITGYGVACASCHNPERAFTDGRPTSVGIHAKVGQRNAPTILNALYNNTQFWDGRAKTLEDQAALPIIKPIEMGQPNLNAAATRIAALPSADKRPSKNNF